MVTVQWRSRLTTSGLRADRSREVRTGVKQVGQTSFSVPELIRIGVDMIKAFGNHHIVFWNCQMFAKCYLRVIAGSDAALYPLQD